MKKTTLIFLTTFFFFVGITTTKAADKGVLQVNSTVFDKFITWENYIPSSGYENYISGYNQLYEYMNIDLETEDYIIWRNSIESNYEINGIKWSKNYQFKLNPGIYTGFNNNVSQLGFIFMTNTSSNFSLYRWTNSKGLKTYNGDYTNYASGYNYYSITSSDITNSNGIYYFEETVSDRNFVYSSSMPLNFYYNNTGISNTYWNNNFSKLQIKYPNDEILELNSGDTLIKNGSLISPDNIFHETIYTTNYNSIEFEFDLASLPLYSEGNTFNLDFEFKSVTQSGEDETIKFSLPYYILTQLVDSTTEEGASITLTKEDIEKYFKQDNYIYTYSNSEKIRYLNDLGVLEKNYTKYKITLPLEFSYASFVDVYVKSNLDFEVIRNYSSSYDESVVSDIETIDLTNKYGVVFIPLVKNGSIHFPFKSVGHFFVQHRDSYNEDFNILSTTTVGYCDEYHKNDENYNCADLSGLYSFTFKKGFDNQVLTFINRNYENDTNSFVEYHSNSFNYCVLDTPTSTCNIINPNTDEEVNLTLKDYFDYKTESNNESFFEMFSNAFNRFKTAILSIFDYISIYFESLPSILKDFYIVIFVFVILAVIVKFLI